MEEQLITSQKKRGRKPSTNKNQENSLTPKKRGRKPKDKLGIIDTNTKILTEENVILHLHISDDEEPTLDNPEPFDNTNFAFTNVDNNKINFIEENEEVTFTKSTIVKTDTYENIVKKREIELNQKTNDYNTLMIDFVEYKKMNKWPEKTTIPCMHDGYEFSGSPFGIPIKIENGVCHMYGNCCSPSCAAAFNFATNLDSNSWERYSLMCYIYNNNKPIFIANSKLLLEKWGEHIILMILEI